jgi:hypothetical protein
VNGGDFCAMAVNSSKTITVDNSASLSATWTIQTNLGIQNKSSSTTAKDGLFWQFP